MDLKQGIMQRKSIRGFKEEPVPQEVLREVLKLGTRAVSANNTQPWEIAVITGDVLDAIKKDNVACLKNAEKEDYPDAPTDGVYKERSRTIGKQLFQVMEIAREDKERRSWWLERGFRFFDAPAAIILYMDDALDEAAFRFDIGCVAQNICLAAEAYGLGTCVEYQAVMYQRGLRKYLKNVANKKFICGIAIGYPDPDFPANTIISEREDIDNITQWYGW